MSGKKVSSTGQPKCCSHVSTCQVHTLISQSVTTTGLLGMLNSNADSSQELHQASLLRNHLLFRAVSVINGLQHDTDNLVAATELEHDSPSYLKSAPAFKSLETGKFSALAPTSTPVIKIPARFRKPSAASTANTDHAYQRSMHDAAEQRNLLLKRAYDVICNLQVCFNAPLC